MLSNQPGPRPGPAARRGRPEQRARRAFDDAAQLAELLVRTSRRLQKSSVAELGPIGVTGAQARVMRYLEAAGQPLRMADIAALLEVVPRTATTVVDDLEHSGLVERAADRKDRRSVLVSLTDKGRLLLDEVASARRRTAERTFSGLSEAERGELMRLLTVCCGPCGCSMPGERARAERGARGGAEQWQ